MEVIWQLSLAYRGQWQVNAHCEWGRGAEAKANKKNKMFNYHGAKSACRIKFLKHLNAVCVVTIKCLKKKIIRGSCFENTTFILEMLEK